MKRLRLTACASVALALVGAAAAVASPSAAAAPRPAGVSLVRTYETAQGVKITWADPHSAYKHLAFRYQRGATAPAIGKGTWVPLRHDAASATLRKLTPGAQYSVSIWTYSGSHYSPRATTTFRAPHAAASTRSTLRGVITDSAGHPLRGVYVLAFDDAGSTFYDDTTDPKGTFALRVAPGHYFIGVETGRAKGGDSDSTGYLAAFRERQVGANSTVELDLALRAGGALTGRVVDRNGKPVQGATIYERSADPVLDFFGSLADSSGGAGPTLSRADGTYVLRGALSSAGQVCVAAASGASELMFDPVCSTTTYAVAPHKTRSAGDTVLRAASSHTGTISVTVSAAGKRVDHASVLAATSSGNSSLLITSQADATGHFTLPGLAPGRYTVCGATSPSTTRVHTRTGYQPACTRVRVQADKTTTVSVALPVGAAVTGTVTGPHGPVAYTKVSIVAPGREAEDSISGLTDKNGRYTVTGLRPGVVKACAASTPARTGLPTGATGACHSSKPALLTKGTTRLLDIGVRAGAAVKGDVRTAKGAVATGAVDVLGARDGTYKTYMTTTRTGHYVIGGLDAGRYHLCATSSLASDLVPTSCGRVTTVTGRAATLDLQLAPAGAVRATAHDAAGHALAGVEAVLLKPCTAEEGDETIYDGCGTLDSFSATRTVSTVAGGNTEGNGSVTLTGLKPGRYGLCLLGFRTASATTDLPASGVHDTCTKGFSVVVSDAATTTVARVLGQGAGVSGRVVDANGKGIAGVRVFVSHAAVVSEDYSNDYGVEPADAVTAADGTYSLRSATPGAQTICFDASSAGTSKVGYRDQCIGGTPGSLDGGTKTTLVAGANTVPDQTLQSGPPRIGRAHARPTARAPMSRTAMAFARARAAWTPAAAVFGAGSLPRDAAGIADWWRVHAATFAAVPARDRALLGWGLSR